MYRMTDPIPQQTLAADLSLASRKMRNLFDALVRERGLTLARARALLLLAETRTWTQRELAEELEIEQPTVVRLLDGMEKQGLIVRQPVAGDRRANHIKLTAIGSDHLEDLRRATGRLREALVSGLTALEITNAGAVLRAINQNLDTAITEFRADSQGREFAGRRS